MKTNGTQRLEDMINKGIDKQKVLGVLNSLEVIEQEGGDFAYILVENSKGNRDKLNMVGISNETIEKYEDEEVIDLIEFAFGESIADNYVGGKFVRYDESAIVYFDEGESAVFYKLNGSIHLRFEGSKGKMIDTILSGDELESIKYFLSK